MERQEKPRLRRIDAQPVELQGKRYLVLNDPLRLSGRQLFLPLEAAFVLNLLNGTNSILDLKTEYTRRTGYMLVNNPIDQLIQVLDENLLLENDHFRTSLAMVEENFRQSGVRPWFHAGLSYPSDPGELRELIDGFYNHKKGPGIPPSVINGTPAVGLAAPHIDLRSGGPTFAWAYHALAQSPPPDRFVILGTAHQGAENLFCLSSLDFETPLGRVQTDRSFVERLTSGSPLDYCKDEILHRSEHTIEFQTIFLQHLYGESVPYTIVPVLCSLDPEFFFLPGMEDKQLVFRDFVHRMHETIEKSSGRTCLIASVDLDHIGPRYGDNFQPNEATIRQSLNDDRELLGYLEHIDDCGFLDMARKINPLRKICGFGPLYTLSKLLDHGQGKILSIDHATVDQMNSFVTFAAMIFQQS